MQERAISRKISTGFESTPLRQPVYAFCLHRSTRWRSICYALAADPEPRSGTCFWARERPIISATLCSLAYP